MPATIELESQVHARFDAHRLLGEWFTEVRAITEWIDQMNAAVAVWGIGIDSEIRGRPRCEVITVSGKQCANIATTTIPGPTTLQRACGNHARLIAPRTRLPEASHGN